MISIELVSGRKTVQVLESAPILIIGFNRPDLMRKQINVLRTFHPQKLYFHIDGPRKKSISDVDLIQKNLEEIDGIDWKVSIEILRRSENMGCQASVVGALEWVFKHERTIIVLEDDIEFDQKFIHFCNNKLDEFNLDNSILAVCGYNPIINKDIKKYDHVKYVISSYPMLWGWATWKDKWLENYEIDPKISLAVIGRLLRYNNFNFFFTALLLINLLRIKSKRLDTWDYQVFISSAINYKKFVIPSQNLTRNLGFREDATHTKTEISEKVKKFERGSLNYDKHFDKNYRKYNRKIFATLLAQRLFSKKV
jgi:hypothetical protein